MEYRVLGRTGLRVSVLGLGGHEYRRWLPGMRDMEEFMRTQPERNKLIREALNAGINYFDTTFIEEVESLGLALKEIKPKRENIYISIMSFRPFKVMAENPSPKWEDIIINDVEKRLRLLGSSYADVLTLYSPEDNFTEERLKIMVNIFNSLKYEGKIRFLGASSHNIRFLSEIMRRYNCFDVVMVRYNFHLQETRELIFPLANKLNVGVVIMKPFSWPYYGIPFMRFRPDDVDLGGVSPVHVCLRWIVKSPEVSTVVPSVNSINELKENLNAISFKGEVKDDILKRYLDFALSPRGIARLKEMTNAPERDIRYWARKALSRKH